jgi:putative nucleotidyltransferase with HDIG domain
MDFSCQINGIAHISLLRNLIANEKNDLWLVGGVLRDLYLGKKKVYRDFDFCVEKNTLKFVKKFSSAVNAKFIILDEEQETYRVIVKENDSVRYYDFTAMRGKSLAEDLKCRDFTVNSLGVSLKDSECRLIDLCGSCRDLKSGILRSVSGKVFADDPLRILRGFSFMANYGFTIDKKTLSAMKKYKRLLKNVSGERLGEEFLKIFNGADSFKAVKLLSDTHILDEIIPFVSSARGVTQGDYHHLDVWRHSLETLRCFERLCVACLKKDKLVFDYLNEELAQNRRRIQIVKLACLLHDIGKPKAKAMKDKKTIFYGHEEIGRKICRKVALRLKLSSRERDVLGNLVFWHLRPGYLADTKTPTARAVYRYFRDTAEEGVSVSLLSLADWRATRGKLTRSGDRKNHDRVMLGLVGHYFAQKAKKPLPKIIDGYDIMKTFKLKPSPLVGVILNAVKEEQALGNINDKAGALLLAAREIEKRGG